MNDLLSNSIVQNLVKYTIAIVWIVNGLLCKVLNFVPRHEQIVARILGYEFSRPLTILIGISEIGIALWFLTGVKSKWNIIVQIGVVIVMNIIELIMATDLLLWGTFNSFFAFLFILMIYFNFSYSNKVDE